MKKYKVKFKLGFDQDEIVLFGKKDIIGSLIDDWGLLLIEDSVKVKRVK